ncbi:MAG: neutral/alkaline non-lysosomal ceramidase N-terminal domain-containing protein [Kiritimatiellaeota bacterium]|nr:neutral/alkaline non-lysosomal ceramidase N-terminal domain-containing protein [Kiritimatiellota bacterium]
MQAGLARIEITPSGPIRMEGMLRAHDSTGVHDPIFAKALVLSNGPQPADAFAIVALDVCAMSAESCRTIRALAEKRTGIPFDRIIVAAKHNHSGPATRDPENATTSTSQYNHSTPADRDSQNEREKDYVQSLVKKVVAVIEEAAGRLEPVAIGCASGREETISHYRRLLADDGHVVMNWEPWPAERIVRPLGVIDPEVGVLKIVSADGQNRLLGVLFNHAGHPNVMSGDNYLITPDYPGRAEVLLEEKCGGLAIFVNGAQGTMDIDGLRDRDWAGIERVGGALAEAVAGTLTAVAPRATSRLRRGACHYTVPARKISDEEKTWAETIVKQTGGVVKPVADGVGDDYKANLFLRLWKAQDQAIDLEQTCLAVDDCAFISFPGELFTEIGQRIKAASPFRHTYILGLANGSIGYVPTREAIRQGGYEPLVRRVDDSAAEIIEEQSLALLRRVHGLA